MRLKLFYVHLKTAKWAFGDVFNAIYHMQIDVFSVYLLGTDYSLLKIDLLPVITRHGWVFCTLSYEGVFRCGQLYRYFNV